MDADWTDLRLLRDRRLADYYVAMSGLDCVISGKEDDHLRRIGILADVTSWFDPDKYMADKASKTIFKACLILAKKKIPYQSRTLGAALAALGRNDEEVRQTVRRALVDGDFCLQSLYLEFNCRVVYEHWRAEQAMATLDKSQQQLLDGATVEEALAILERARIPDPPPLLEQSQRSCSFVHDFLDSIENPHNRVSTGISGLDGLLDGGLKKKALYVVSAATGGGKSVLMGQIALNAASSGLRVIYFTLEMPGDEVVGRWICSLAGKPKYNRDALVEPAAVVNEMLNGKSPVIRLYDQVSKLSDIVAITKSQFRHVGADLIVVDYLQLVAVPRVKGKDSTREREVAEVSRTLKRLARECDCPVLTAAQVNREGQKNPKLGTLRESSAIEQDADVLIFIRPPDQNVTANTWKIMLATGKSRNSANGAVTLAWDRDCFRMRDTDLLDTDEGRVSRHSEFDEFS